MIREFFTMAFSQLMLTRGRQNQFIGKRGITSLMLACIAGYVPTASAAWTTHTNIGRIYHYNNALYIHTRAASHGDYVNPAGCTGVYWYHIAGNRSDSDALAAALISAQANQQPVHFLLSTTECSAGYPKIRGIQVRESWKSE